METSNSAFLHVIYEDYVGNDFKRLEETFSGLKNTNQVKADDLYRLNLAVANYAVNRNVNNFFIKLG